MKRILFLALAMCAGCSTHYRVTLQNGQTITTLSKPVLDKSQNFYTFKTMATIPAGSVRLIEPASYKQTPDSRYLPTTTPTR